MLIPDSAHGTNPASAAIAGFDAVTIKSNAKGLVDMDDLQVQARRPHGRVHDDQSEHARPVRSSDRRHHRAAARTRGPGLSRRGQHERHSRHHPARRFRRRHDALQRPQDVHRPARRRRPGLGPHRGAGPPGPVLPAPMVVKDERCSSSWTTIVPSRSAGCAASSATSASCCAAIATFARSARPG